MQIKDVVDYTPRVQMNHLHIKRTPFSPNVLVAPRWLRRRRVVMVTSPFVSGLPVRSRLILWMLRVLG